METIKNYGYLYSYSYYENVRKIVIALMILYFMLCLISPESAHAAGADFGNTDTNNMVGNDETTGLPWEGPMATLQRSLTGPIAKSVAMVVVVVAGIFVALGEGGPAGRLVGRLVFGLGLLFGAISIIDSFMRAQ